MARATGGSELVPGAVAAAPVGVATWHWAAATHRAGTGGASAVEAAAGPGLAGADGEVPGVAGTMMEGPGGLGVYPQGGVIGTEIRETGDVRAGTGENNGDWSSRVSG